jgi:hypothetical protein
MMKTVRMALAPPSPVPPLDELPPLEELLLLDELPPLEELLLLDELPPLEELLPLEEPPLELRPPSIWCRCSSKGAGGMSSPGDGLSVDEQASGGRHPHTSTASFAALLMGLLIGRSSRGVGSAS